MFAKKLDKLLFPFLGLCLFGYLLIVKVVNWNIFYCCWSVCKDVLNSFPFLVLFEHLSNVVGFKVMELNSARVMKNIKLCIFQTQNWKSKSPKVLSDMVKLSRCLNLNNCFTNSRIVFLHKKKLTSISSISS